MGTGEVSVAAATAVVGYDLFSGTWFQNMARNRALVGIAVKGSGAALDTKVTLQVDTVKIGDYYNNNTGAVNMDDVKPLDGNWVPAGALVHCYVEDAPVTNPINVTLVWKDL